MKSLLVCSSSCSCSCSCSLTFPVRTVDEDYDSLLGQRQRLAEEGDTDEITVGM